MILEAQSHQTADAGKLTAAEPLHPFEIASLPSLEIL